MEHNFEFIKENTGFIIVLSILNIFIAFKITKKIKIYLNRHVREALGERKNEVSVFARCSKITMEYFNKHLKAKIKSGIFSNAKSKMRKAGYIWEYSPAIYVFLKYVVTAAFFITAFVLNYPKVKGAFILALSNVIIIEMVVKSRKKRLNMKFQKNAYKIYKYLHNQISSGVKVTDAVKGVYEVIDDKYLKNILIRVAAGYELTLDIDTALEEFMSRFDGDEAETLCIAIKQGIMTGDNRELLSRQEEVMFNKYFNYIQAETDNCRNRSFIAAGMFTVVIVIMILVPLLNDMTQAIEKIFIY
jgi:Flp pilus assembly protein TadB